MKVIFLDIDGVLNSSKTIDRNFDYPELDPRNLKVLKDIVELSHAVLVLISSWKDEWNKEGEPSRFQSLITYQLNEFGLDIYDCTSDKIYNRGEGIISWLDCHETESWCVIDDEIFLYYEKYNIMRHLVKTSYMDGLTQEFVENVCNRLSCTDKIKSLQIDDTAIPLDETDPRYRKFMMSAEERRRIEMKFKLITIDDEVFIRNLLKEMDNKNEICLDKQQMNKLSDIIRKSNIL